MDLAAIYREYINCINKRDWKNLGLFVHHEVHHNGRYLGLEGYQAMLEQDYEQIPDLHFNIALLVAGQNDVACRLLFNVTPRAEFLELPVNGRKITFCEHAFYTYRSGLIGNVWSVIDKAAIERQLR